MIQAQAWLPRKEAAHLQLNREGKEVFEDQVDKSIGWMPWRRKAMKDVVSCEKSRGGAKHPLIRECLNGGTQRESCPVTSN